MSARLLERVERFATERFGQGAAVELGRKALCLPAWQPSIHICTIWRPDGTMALRAETSPTEPYSNTRAGVLRLMLGQLQAEEVRT